jgi:hypothetical protein
VDVNSCKDQAINSPSLPQKLTTLHTKKAPIHHGRNQRMFGSFSAGLFTKYDRIVTKTSPKEEYEDHMKLYQL